LQSELKGPVFCGIGRALCGTLSLIHGNRRRKKKFAKLIGKIIHNCGILEFLTNSLIDNLETNKTRSAKIFILPFRRRIEALDHLVKDRTKLSTEKIDSFCKQLSFVADTRNIVAHNPICSKSSRCDSPHIIVLRGLTDISDVFKAKILTEKDLENILEQTREAITAFWIFAYEAGIAKPEFADEQTKV
jgi:hypothetical protein